MPYRVPGANATSSLPGQRQPQSDPTSRPFDSAVRQLRADCAALGVSTPVPLRVRVALRRRLHLRHHGRALLYKAALVVSVAMLPLGAYTALIDQITEWDRDLEAWHPDTDQWWYELLFGEQGHGLDNLRWMLVALAPVAQAFVPLFVLLRVLLAIAENQANLTQPRTRMERLLLARRYTLVFECAEAINACARARRGGEGQPARIKEVSRKLSVVRRSVLIAHRRRKSLPFLSGRRKRLKEHQLKVAAALDDLEAQIDQDSGLALREIAESLLMVADRYCEGRNGALLDENRLTGVPRQRDWDVLRYLIALGLAGGGITGLALTEFIPESAESYVFMIVALVAFIIAFGRKFRRALDVISVIGGPP